VSEQQPAPQALPPEEERLALLEAVVYVAEEPLTLEQIAGGLELPAEVVQADLERLIDETRKPYRGLEVRKIAKGYKMFTKAEHHEAVRRFVQSLRPKLRLSLPALETLAVIAYKQPITVPEIQAVRGVNVSGVINTLLQRKLITPAGRKKVVGKPILYKTTREFLVEFGLSDISELPNLKELEELSRSALGEGEEPAGDEEESSGGEAAEEASPEEDAAEAESGPEADAAQSGQGEQEREEQDAAAEPASEGDEDAAPEPEARESEADAASPEPGPGEERSGEERLAGPEEQQEDAPAGGASPQEAASETEAASQSPDNPEGTETEDDAAPSVSRN